MDTRFVFMFKQNLWANLSLLDVCKDLSDEQLDVSIVGVYGSVRKTLMHVCAAEERYVFLLTGKRPKPELSERETFVGFAKLRERAQKSGEALIEVAEQGDDGQVIELFYGEQKHKMAASVVMLQAINHGVDHRSQISTVLSQQGIEPPELDGWSYYMAMQG